MHQNERKMGARERRKERERKEGRDGSEGGRMRDILFFPSNK
jgi:hypothetical protein